MTRPRTCIVFGAGPGIGNHTAQSFAAAGLDHIVLLSRNLPRLQTKDQPFVAAGSPSTKVSTLSCDLADLSSLPSVLKQIDELTRDEDVEVIFFNAARIKATENVLGVHVDEIHEDLKTTTLALYVVAQHFLPGLVKVAEKKGANTPALIVTSSHLPRTPVPQLLSLSLAKAAQANMVHSLYLAFKERGVVVGLVSVEGDVAPENKVLSPANIAARTVEWWGKNGERELELRLIEENA